AGTTGLGGDTLILQDDFNLVMYKPGGTPVWVNGARPGVTFPVTADSGVTRIGSSGNGHMQTAITIDRKGALQASTHTWDTSPWGFLTGVLGACPRGSV